jgi:nitrite reductase/ring-hydroxylating ferredoxin subunit
MSSSDPAGEWVRAADLEELQRKGSLLFRRGGKQIVLFHGERGIYACNNRCPHEGYPLKEGTLSDGCILTCNWHNWKFDLEDGETLVGGDKLRRYPVELRDGEVWLDLTDPPAEVRAGEALAALKDCFHRIDRRMEYDRLAREVARLQQAGSDPLVALRAAIGWTHDRFEFGATHAQAASADWLALRATRARDEAERLVPLAECLGHLAWDSLREPVYPYPEGRAAYDPDALVEAIEREDEEAAIALARGALAEGLAYADIEAPLARAALAHYADFGHSLIYVYKTGQLIERLGAEVTEPLVLALVRSLVYAFREDLIPEFRFYADALAGWERPTNGHGPACKGPRATDFTGLSIKQTLKRALESREHPEALYEALFGAAAWSLAYFDRRVEARTDGPVSQNAGWLDMTHSLTFANAVRSLCTRTPDLWPRGLLQMACFVGRNNGYVDSQQDIDEWRVTDPEAFFDKSLRMLFDHGQFEYIVSAHMIKLLTAAEEEVSATPAAPWQDDLLTGVNRFLHTPIKRKHAIRTARQSLEFIALEG